MPIRSYALDNQKLYASDDSGASWSEVTLTFPVGNAASNPTSVACDPYSIDNVIITAGPLTGLQISNTGGNSWTQVPGTTGGIYPWLNARYKDSLNVIATSNKVSLSTDGGNTFTDTVNTAASIYPASGVQLITALAYNNNSVGFLSVYDKLFRSNDGGTTWFACNNDLPVQNSVYIRSIAYRDNLVLVTTDQKVYRSDDGGVTFTDVLTINSCISTNPSDKKSSISITNFDVGVVCVDCFNYVYSSSDGGLTWVPLGQVFSGGSQNIVDVFVYNELLPTTNFIIGTQASSSLYLTSNGGITYVSPLTVLSKFTDIDSTTNMDPCGECPELYTYNGTTGYCEATLPSASLCPEGYTYNIVTGICEAVGLDPITPEPCPEDCTTVVGDDNRGYCLCLQQILITSCCYSLTDCSGISETIYTQTDLLAYLSQIVKIEGCDTCWIVGQVPEGCPESREVIVDSSYVTCEECLPTYNCGTCPEGYTLNEQNECELTTTSPAVYTGPTTTVTQGNLSNTYGNLSLCLLEDISSYAFPILGTGSNNANYDFKDNDGSGISVARAPGYSPVTFGSGTGTILNELWWSSPVSGTLDGRLNISGVWASGISDCDPYTNTPAGCENEPGYYLLYTYCINIPEDKQYTIGIAADNEVHVTVNNTLVLKLSAQNGSVTIPFRNWTVFPITLSAGQNIIELKGFNFGGLASFAAEIYNLTKAEFIANVCTPGIYSGGWVDPGSTPADLEPYILFTTRDTVGQQVPAGEGQYECPDGSTANFCDGDALCTCTTYLPYVDCCYILTDCIDEENTIYTSTNLEEYLDKIVKIEGYDECWFVSVDIAACLVPNTVVVTDSFDECNVCLPSFVLYNCKDKDVVLYTETNLASVAGETIQVDEFPNDCWQVGPNPNRLLPLQVITQSGDSFGSCAECDPPKYQLNNCFNDSNFIISDSDLQAVLNKTISIVGYPGICFSVGLPTCECIKISGTLSAGPFTTTIQATGIIVNNRNQYAFTNGGNNYFLNWNSTASRWELNNQTTSTLVGYSGADVDCPYTSYWVNIPSFSVESCATVIYDITVDKVYPDCECCITKNCI